jgi:predicted aspartyl protease
MDSARASERPLCRGWQCGIIGGVICTDMVRLFRRVLIFFVLGLPILDVAAAGQPAKKTEIAEFQVLPLIRSRQNHLLVRVLVNGQEAWLTVDSGSPISAISISRRDHFHLNNIASNSELPARVQVNEGFGNMAVARSFRLGALTLLDEPVVMLNLKNPSPASRLVNDERVDGILGTDILLPLEAVLDCQAQTLILKMNPGHPGQAPGVDYRGYDSVKLQVSPGSNLYVNGSINGIPGKFMVDTGAPVTILHHAFVQQIHVATRGTRIVSTAINLKDQGVRVATIQRFSLGSIRIRGGMVGVSDLGGLIHTPMLTGTPPFAGLLGGEILDRDHGIIDFGTHTLYMRK